MRRLHPFRLTTFVVAIRVIDEWISTAARQQRVRLFTVEKELRLLSACPEGDEWGIRLHVGRREGVAWTATARDNKNLRR
jgi:hypothetical protein